MRYFSRVGLRGRWEAAVLYDRPREAARTFLSNFVYPKDGFSDDSIECSCRSASTTSRDANGPVVAAACECKPQLLGRELELEFVNSAVACAYVDQWNELARRCLEVNVFMEPAFALPAARHLGGGRASFLFVWERGWAGAPKSLIAVCAFQLSGDYHFDFFARSWVHKQSTLGTPLLDSARAETALHAILAWRRDAFPYLVGTAFPKLPLSGATFGVLKRHAARHRLYVRVLDEHSRAVLRQKQNAERFLLESLSPTRRKSLGKARRRLEAKGNVTFWMSSNSHEAQTAFEEFLKLEARGWKGRRGTALRATSDTATFSREMIAALAQGGQCRIARLDFGGRTIALGVLLISGATAFFWKIAYDEEYAQFSPGVLLSCELSRALIQDPKIATTDSCACADHPMIDRLWPEKMAVGDVFISNAVNRQFFIVALVSEYLLRFVRQRLKEVQNSLRCLLISK